MDRLKVAISEKILKLSSDNLEEMKDKLIKIQRFRDFADACKSLMIKYPEIESELLEMVEEDDFDASRASRRVDFVISRIHAVNLNNSTTGKSEDYAVNSIDKKGDKIDTKVNNYITDVEIVNDEANDNGEERVDYEMNPSNKNEVFFSTATDYPIEDNQRKERRQKQLTMLWQILAVVVTILILVFLVQFVVKNWKVILIVLGSLVFAYLLWRYLKWNKKKSEKK